MFVKNYCCILSIDHVAKSHPIKLCSLFVNLQHGLRYCLLECFTFCSPYCPDGVLFRNRGRYPVRLYVGLRDPLITRLFVCDIVLT